MKRKPLVYLPSGDLGPIPSGDHIEVISFSKKKILEEEILLVPEDMQMLLHGDIKIDGILKLDGELCLL